MSSCVRLCALSGRICVNDKSAEGNVDMWIIPTLFSWQQVQTHIKSHTTIIIMAVT